MHKNSWSHGCDRKAVLNTHKDSLHVFSNSLEASFW